MEQTDIVHVITAVLGEQRILVYGEDVLRHVVHDGERERLSFVEVPIRHPEAAVALKASPSKVLMFCSNFEPP
jgi:hypothetical protein